MIRQVLLLSILLLSTQCAGRAPVPVCMSKPVLSQSPLTQGEKVIVKMDEYFSGYNLDLKVATNSSFARLNSKLEKIDKRASYLPGIIAHIVENSGNDWGKEAFILYRDMTGSIIFTFGRLTDQSHVPSLDYTVIVSTDKSVNCFGAALLLDYGVAVIDCMKETIDQGVSTLQNYFHYVDLTNGKLTKVVKNSMYVKYKTVTKRLLMKYKDAVTNYEYLLRVYPADGVNHEQRGNTYMEIYSIRDPYDIQIMKVIDRTYLHISSLAITEAQVYLGDIFFLDYLHGLYRLDILANNDVLITGRYNKEGFNKFAVYSDDLEDEVIIALANQHAVYEIDWSNVNDPVMLNKYSLMEHSRVRELHVNDLFVIVQSTANATNETNPNFEVDYTWIFSKGARTYSHAYAIINHNSSNVDLQFNRGNDKLLAADESGITLYQISEPFLTLEMDNAGRIGSKEDIVVTATSTDPNSNITSTCQVRSTVNFVKMDDMTIYKQEHENTPEYSINSPGELRINLDRYVMGPNITYSIVNGTSHHKIPQQFINKLNRTTLDIDASIGEVIFYHTQVVPAYGRNRIIYYIQDSRYFTHVIECTDIWEDAHAKCHQEAKFAHNSAIESFTTAFFPDSEGFNYFYIVVFQENLKQIRIFDYTRHKILLNITYLGHQEAEVTDIASGNGYLYVLRGAVKTIDVYKLEKCQKQGSCKPEFSINSNNLKPTINYFAPQKLLTHPEHPEVLFVKCLGSVVILDIDNKQKLTVLDVIESEATANLYFRMALSRNRLIIVSNPDIVDVYSLDHIYIKNEVKYMSRLPLYGYEIQPVSDIEFSDFSNMIYINAIDRANARSVILIYRANLPAALALYQTIPLRRIYSRPALEIEVSGFYVDYLNIKNDDGFTLYRVFSEPSATIKDVTIEYQFQIGFSNSKTQLSSQLLSVAAVNFPAGFRPTEELNRTLNSLKLDSSGNFTWEDRNWFSGHVVSYNFTCDECGENQTAKVHLKEHVDPMQNIHFTAYDYVQTLSGGVAVSDDLFRFNLNGTVRDVINLPDQKLLERCSRVSSAFGSSLLVTACQQLGRGVNLYVTTETSYKAWTWGPYRSSAYNVRNLQIAGDVLMLTDTSVYPEFKFEKGSIFLYALTLDSITGQDMQELQVIDENDLTNVFGYDKDTAYIANSHLVYSAVNRCYRLYITEVDNGLFVVDFTHEPGRREINIITITYVNINKKLEEVKLHMPSDATYQAVSLVSYKYNPNHYVETVIVSTKGYHNIEVYLIFNDEGKLLESYIWRIYYRYGYYNAINEIKTASGYVAIPYLIPYEKQFVSNYTRQIIAVYDTSDYEGDHENAYSQRYMLGGVRYNKTSLPMFAFNTTYDFRSNGTRIGLVVTDPFVAPEKNMMEYSLSKNLTLELKSDFKDQVLTLVPFSDFEVRSFEIHLINIPSGPESIMVIIIIVLAALITLGFAVYIFILVKNRKKKINDGERVSLLTEGESIRNSVEPRAGEYLPPQSLPDNQEELRGSSEEEDEDEDEDEENEQTQAKLGSLATETTAAVPHEKVVTPAVSVVTESVVEQKPAEPAQQEAPKQEEAVIEPVKVEEPPKQEEQPKQEEPKAEQSQPVPAGEA